MYRSGKDSPHSHGTPMDVVPTTAEIPSTLNPLPRYTVNFNPIPAVIPQIPLPCHSLIRTLSQPTCIFGLFYPKRLLSCKQDVEAKRGSEPRHNVFNSLRRADATSRAPASRKSHRTVARPASVRYVHCDVSLMLLLLLLFVLQHDVS